MPNRWITYVKQWAAKKGMSYACALSQPQLKKDYRKAYPTKQQQKTREAVERGEMEDEDIFSKESEKKLKQELDEKRRLIEMSRMMGEDRNISNVKNIIAKLNKKPTMEKEKKKKPLIIEDSSDDEEHYIPKNKNNQEKFDKVKVGDEIFVEYLETGNPSERFVVKRKGNASFTAESDYSGPKRDNIIIIYKNNSKYKWDFEPLVSEKPKIDVSVEKLSKMNANEVREMMMKIGDEKVIEKMLKNLEKVKNKK
jgi:hypothetical protein